jgi:hypothetical protein
VWAFIAGVGCVFEVPMQKPFVCWFFFLKKLVRNFDYGLYPDVVLSDDSVLIGCFFNPLNDAFIKFKEHSVTYEPSSTKKFPIGNLFEITSSIIFCRFLDPTTT